LVWSGTQTKRGINTQGSSKTRIFSSFLTVSNCRPQPILPMFQSMAGQRLQYLTTNDWVLVQAKAAPRIFKLGEEIIQQGEGVDSIYIIRRGEASVQLGASGSRAILAKLGPEDICGEIAFLEKGKATAAVIASDEKVEADQLDGQELRSLFAAFPGLASRFYQSLATILAERLRLTSRELAREMMMRDLHQK
jgi:signal-transduction protein with cAMP-binding, CBS, and nucleotidyltransferase domain